MGLGVLLLVFGWRGIRSGHAPHCRKCQSQLAEEEGLIPLRCSECGRGLTGNRSVRLGARKKRPLCAWFGVLLLGISLAWFVSIGWITFRSVNWMPHMPNWWLVEVELGSFDEGWRTAVLKELDSRIANNKLGHAHRQYLINQGLEMQLDETRQWNQYWGDVIEQGIIDGFLSEAELSQYARGTIELTCSTDNLGRVTLWFRVHRAGSRGRLRFGLAYKVDYLIVDGEKTYSDEIQDEQQLNKNHYDGVTFVSLSASASIGPHLTAILPEGINADNSECLLGVRVGWHRSLLKNSTQMNPIESCMLGLSYLGLGESPWDSGEMNVWEESYLINGEKE